MNNAIQTMLARYHCRSLSDYENALKEIIQEVALLGLWRGKFFEKAAFYGGTALRILYNLNRFSEDLDFSLLKQERNFQLDPYLKFVTSELSSFGFIVSIDLKTKTTNTAIQSAFIKAGTKENFIKIEIPEKLFQPMHRLRKLKIKIEVDTDPPGGFKTEAKLVLQPVPFTINTYEPPDLFAGKIHAILYRAWKSRVKGRDWYDLVWYVSKNIVLNLHHLQKRLEQTQNWEPKRTLTHDHVVELLNKKIETINFSEAKKDVIPFLKDPGLVKLWSADFFKEIVGRIKVIGV